MFLLDFTDSDPRHRDLLADAEKMDKYLEENESSSSDEFDSEADTERDVSVSKGKSSSSSAVKKKSSAEVTSPLKKSPDKTDSILFPGKSIGIVGENDSPSTGFPAEETARLKAKDGVLREKSSTGSDVITQEVQDICPSSSTGRVSPGKDVVKGVGKSLETREDEDLGTGSKKPEVGSTSTGSLQAVPEDLPEVDDDFREKTVISLRITDRENGVENGGKSQSRDSVGAEAVQSIMGNSGTEAETGNSFSCLRKESRKSSKEKQDKNDAVAKAERQKEPQSDITDDKKMSGNPKRRPDADHVTRRDAEEDGASGGQRQIPIIIIKPPTSPEEDQHPDAAAKSQGDVLSG